MDLPLVVAKAAIFPYKVLMRNRFIFIKDDLHPVMERIVMPVSYTHLDVYKRQVIYRERTIPL